MLFVCGKNRWRSPTAEDLYAGREDIDVLSAGTASDADVRIDAELLDWADRIFTMEARQRRWIRTRFPDQVKGKSIVNLGIPDRYRYMDSALVALLHTKLAPHLS